MEYSRDLVIGNGVQGPFDHLLALKNINQSPYRQDRFNPNDLFLYAVTDSGMNKKWGRSIAEAVKAAVEGGATIVQLRFVTFLFFIILIVMQNQCFLQLIFASRYSFYGVISRTGYPKELIFNICSILFLDI